MKRSEFLKSLSHDHHQTLFQSMRLRRATTEDAAEVAAAYLDLWRREGAEHFREEEEILLPIFAEHGDPDHPLVTRVLGEHLKIRTQVRRLEREVASEGPDLAFLHGLGEDLAAHVRLEERELFPLIEEKLPAEAVAEVADRIVER